MGKRENLIPYDFTSDQSRELAAMNGRKGGIASGKAKRKKKDLREMAQAILDGTFEKDGESFTGAELVQNGLIANLSDPTGKNWAKAIDLLVMLTGANIAPEQRENLKANTEKIKAETKRLQGDTEQHNGILEDLIKGLQSDVHTETIAADEDVAAEQAETS